VTFSLHPGAEQDIADAQDFYFLQAGPLVAEHYLDEFERVAKLLVYYPSFGTQKNKGDAHLYCRVERGLPCGSEKFVRKLERIAGQTLRYRPRGRPKKPEPSR